MAIKQNWTEVKKQLKYCDDKSLLGIIQDLYKLNKDNKDYLHLRFLASNDSSQKDELIKKTIEKISKAWDKVSHDPYGYMGSETIARITPVKSHVANYKKAIGTDDGYIQILIEYIMGGFFCLENNCAERSDTIVNTINNAFDEIIDLLKSAKVSPLSDTQWKKLNAFIDSYYIIDTTFYEYEDYIGKKKVMPHIRLTNSAAKKLKVAELHQPDDSCIPFYLDWIIHIVKIGRVDVAICMNVRTRAAFSITLKDIGGVRNLISKFPAYYESMAEMYDTKLSYSLGSITRQFFEVPKDEYMFFHTNDRSATTHLSQYKMILESEAYTYKKLDNKVHFSVSEYWKGSLIKDPRPGAKSYTKPQRLWEYYSSILND